MYIEINFKGEEITVEGIYIEGSKPDYNYPGDPDDFEIEYVWYQDVDIMPFVDVEEVKELVLESI